MDLMRGIEGEGVQAGAGAATDAEIATGVVKWFDPVRGYGFAIADDGRGDILLHHSLIDGHGWRSVPEGARVTLAVRDAERGRQAIALLAIDLTACKDRLGERPHRPESYEGVAGQWVEATVRWFDRGRGYGFLLSDDGTREAFIHMETLRRGGVLGLTSGQRLRACLGDGPRGLVALEVERLESR